MLDIYVRLESEYGENDPDLFLPYKHHVNEMLIGLSGRLEKPAEFTL